MQIDTHIADIIDNIIIEIDIIDMVIIAITSLSTLLSSTVVHQKQSFIASYVYHRYVRLLLRISQSDSRKLCRAVIFRIHAT